MNEEKKTNFLIVSPFSFSVEKDIKFLTEVGADTSARDGMACHVLVVGAGSGVLCWVADEGAVLVALGVLEGARWLGDGAWADVSRALSGGVAFWGAHGTLNTGDGDVDFTGLASSWLERILEVACCLAVALKNKTRSVQREREKKDREKSVKIQKKKRQKRKT